MVDHLTQTPEAERETQSFTDFNQNSDSQTSVYTHFQSQITGMKIKWNREYSLRGDIGFGMLLYQLPFGIDRENPVQRNTHLLIGIHILKSHIHKQSGSLPKAPRNIKWFHLMDTNNYYYHRNDNIFLKIYNVILQRKCMLVSVHVQQSHRGSVAKSSVEWFSVGVEQVLYVCETLNLKLLRFLLNHFPTHHGMTLNVLHLHWKRCRSFPCSWGFEINSFVNRWKDWEK